MTQPAKVRSIRLTDAEWSEYQRRGGTDWLRGELSSNENHKIYLLCVDGEDHGVFDVTGYSTDKDYLEKECERLEWLGYQFERKLYLKNGGDPNYGPLAPNDEKRNGYMSYHVRTVSEVKK